MNTDILIPQETQERYLSSLPIFIPSSRSALYRDSPTLLRPALSETSKRYNIGLWVSHTEDSTFNLNLLREIAKYLKNPLFVMNGECIFVGLYTQDAASGGNTIRGALYKSLSGHYFTPISNKAFIKLDKRTVKKNALFIY